MESGGGNNSYGHFSTLPEAVPEAIPEPAILHHQPNYAVKEAPLPVVTPQPGGHTSQPPWWKRPKVLLILLGVAVLVLAAIIGIVVGVLVSREKS